MNKKNRPRLMTVLEIKHYRNGECIWEEQNIPNTMHLEGQEFLLANAFDTDYGVTVPSEYYLGLDDRTTISVDDDMSSIVGEPSTNGYARQSFSSSTGFVIAVGTSSVEATSGIATFVATIGPWGPVKNVFLTTQSDYSGYLIASAALSSTRTVQAGDSLTARINLTLAGCS